MRRGRRREIAKESKKVRDGLEEQQWRMTEMEEGREACRKRGKRRKQLCFRGSLTTVEHLVHGERDGGRKRKRWKKL